MKKILLIGLLMFLLSFPVRAASEPPAGLSGTLTTISKDANTVTLHAEQTSGTPVTLTIEHYCYQGNIYAGFERIRFQGTTDASFNIGMRTYHGQSLTPTDCWALLEYYFGGGNLLILDEQVTLP